VARLRVHGEVVPDPRFLGGTIDLLAAENGGRLLETSDAFYSSPANIILPGRARVMGEGWENARRRGEGNDFVTFRLAVKGSIRDVVVDTSYFVGNAPGEVRLSAADETAGAVDDPAAWWDVLPRTPVQPDTRHRFLVAARRPATHVRLDVYPDGGLTRLRCNGEVDPAALDSLRQRFWAAIPPSHRAAILAADPDWSS
jgi:allantoicase